MIGSLPIRLMHEIDALARAEQDFNAFGVCLIAMHEQDDQAGLASEADISSDKPLTPGALLRRRIAAGVIARISGKRGACFFTSAQGAPRVEGDAGPFHVSFSARDTLGMVGIARFPIGVDLELPMSAETIPWNILRRDEQSELRALPLDQQAEHFLHLWTVKEAMVKAIGTGLIIPPETVMIEGQGCVEMRGNGQFSTPCSGLILTSGLIRAFTQATSGLDKRRMPAPYGSAVALDGPR